MFLFNALSTFTSALLLFLVIARSRKMLHIRPILLAGATIDLSYALFNAISNYESRPVQLYYFYFSCLSTCCIVNVAFADVMIRRTLKKKKDVMGIKTRRLHAQLSKALLVMAISPVVSSFSQIVYAGVALNTQGGSILPDLISSIVALSGPLINSVTTMYFVRPYRLFFIDLVKRNVTASSIDVFGTQTRPYSLPTR
ncbi:unnamed protein product [Bursaphelenchus xylophilus]|uniref:(pine wood nematode) hypothetical protein n=1 Tax=Bursaphelenchus xylophilus TaxID=6326 RepID=A0A1I7SLI3_BURXY|nr:unnamed protein product [Bursaphelenchus xylophilus]CAG9129618.1 unnamed protein product [Bursaphelenchus xylophilus]